MGRKKGKCYAIHQNAPGRPVCGIGSTGALCERFAGVLFCNKLSRSTMTENDILKFRLTNHLITKGKPDNLEKVVSWMGAIQGQDYGQAKYAIGCRMSNARDRDIEKAITDKKLVRTWAL